MADLIDKTPHERAMVDLHRRCQELYQQLGRDAMLRQNDPVETLFAFVKELISDREYIIGWNDGFSFRDEQLSDMALTAERNAEIERLEAERDHFGELAFDDLGKNPPEAWKDIARDYKARAETAEAALIAEKNAEIERLTDALGEETDRGDRYQRLLDEAESALSRANARLEEAERVITFCARESDTGHRARAFLSPTEPAAETDGEGPE